jgi:hypothetical protein
MSSLIKTLRTLSLGRLHAVTEIFNSLTIFYSSKELTIEIEKIAELYRAEYCRGQFGSASFSDFLDGYGDAIRSLIFFETIEDQEYFMLDKEWDVDEYRSLSDAKWLMIVGLAWVEMAFRACRDVNYKAAACFLREAQDGLDELRDEFKKNHEQLARTKGDQQVALYLKAIELSSHMSPRISFRDQAKGIAEGIREYAKALGGSAVTVAKLEKWLQQEALGKDFFSKG